MASITATLHYIKTLGDAYFGTILVIHVNIWSQIRETIDKWYGNISGNRIGPTAILTVAIILI